MKAKLELACAASHGNVQRLQVRIVKATQGIGAWPRPWLGRLKGLSRMKRKFHVRFLGEGVVATPPPYPTPLAVILSADF